MENMYAQKLVKLLDMYLDSYKAGCLNREDDYVDSGYVQGAQAIIDVIRTLYGLD